MEQLLIGAQIFPVICILIIFILALIIRIRRRRRRRAQSVVLGRSVTHTRNLVDPFSIRDHWLTCAIFFTWTLTYLCEFIFAVDGAGKSFTPSLTTVFALGAVSRNTVLHGEWYRLFTAPFLHSGVPHLLLNGIVLFYAGRILEKQVGRFWFLSIYLLSGLSGSLFSIAIHPPNTLSVGASGAIMGLFAAILVVSFHASNKEKREGLHYISLRIIIPALLPYALQTGTHIDYAAHLGGLIGGGVCTIIMMRNWPENSLPRPGAIAKAIPILLIIATVLSFILVARHYAEFKLLGNCLSAMRQLAKDAGVEPAKYIHDNASYLQNCANTSFSMHP